jgi:hypothetical protein
MLWNEEPRNRCKPKGERFAIRSQRRSMNCWSAAQLAILAAAALVACAPVDDTTIQERSALTTSSTGVLMLFGGQDVTCAQVVTPSSGVTGLQVANCGAAAETFVFDGVTIKNQSSSPLCFDIRFGDLASGVLDLVPCNGTINQQWYVSGGQIVSANKSDGQAHCLDVHFGSHSLGTPIGVAPCNGTAAQSFWPAGPTMEIPSELTVDNHRECLDVAADSETAGTRLDDARCNGTNAQWYVLDTLHRIKLANNQSLCVGLGAAQNGVAPVILKTCSTSDTTQQWSFVNKKADSNGRPITSIANKSLGCLDIFNADPTNGTSVDTFACNGTAAQLWQPILGGPALLTNYGGKTLTAPTIYQVYYGSWWNSPSGHARLLANEQHVKNVVDYLNGAGAPANQVPYLRQYGITGANLATPPTTGVSDSLIRSSNLTVTGGTITSGTPSTMHLSDFTFTSTFLGGTVSIRGASHSRNNGDFIIKKIIDIHHVAINLAPFNHGCTVDTDCPGSTCASDLHCWSAPRPVSETFGSLVRVTISQGGLLSGSQAKGGSNSIEAIVANARAAGQIPNSNDNVLVLVFPSFDFTANSCDAADAKFYAPPAANSSTCDFVGGAYHGSEVAGPRTAYGVMFERIDEPGPRMNDGTSHEIIEALTDPFYNQPNNPQAWIHPDFAETCDLCGNILTASGVSVCGLDDKAGGACTSTGYITFPF